MNIATHYMYRIRINLETNVGHFPAPCKSYTVLRRMSWDSSVGIATRYKLDGQGIESPPISVAERFMGLRVRIPPEAWKFML